VEVFKNLHRVGGEGLPQMRKIVIFLSIILSIRYAAMAEGGDAMKLTSPEFENNAHIPGKFTCRGENVSPALIIEGAPTEAKTLALIVDDPDAPSGTWVHWVMFNIPIISRIEEGSGPGKQGINDSGRIGYDGPCPPFGTHRYVFKLYALDAELDLKEGIGKADLEEAMDGHILAKAELIGLFKK